MISDQELVSKMVMRGQSLVFSNSTVLLLLFFDQNIRGWVGKGWGVGLRVNY
jgi:hypothetical protein